ncbi:SDR family NAD(P)-dependent oxidoreductase [Gordonia sp. NB41Y]|uniref:SDR family NAD(P)-dependent oxidoreductase n=1 Tax=Gordonia sp. NB41Y TaxID=875808 RepID=UPI0006B1598B|nr:SDR family NAD(P)-dependent oxidoreductase [Gordonia sp. NB41Y]EMP13543.2 short-chain dehydrogenase [Gordonia sp. NB41Y]WLP89429.1 SDR family NAD(P)-dependent oxidoreductase [Gordonia sp. NB41Y]
MRELREYGAWAVIAGGSEGVGACFAHRLADAGVNLVLIARKPGPLAQVQAEVQAKGVQVRTLAVDLAAPGSVGQIVEATAGLDVGMLIYNAGANSHGGEFVDGDLDGFRTVLDLNVSTPLALVHHFGAAMKESGRGAIVLVGSMNGYLGAVGQSVYAASKAFGRIFAESLWLELREHGVDVLELVLGVTRTPAMERAGLNFDIPGMIVSEPDDVAAEGLAHLADGPVWVVGENAGHVEARNGADRATIVLRAHEMMRRLVPRADAPR